MSNGNGKSWVKPDLEASSQAVKALSYARYLKLEASPDKFVSNFLRILPGHRNMTGPDGRPCWFRGMFVHYNIGPPGGQQVIGCPRLAKTGDCPICHHAFGLKREGFEKESRDYMPTGNAYLNVVKLKPPTEGEKDLSKYVLADDQIYVLSVRRKFLAMLEDEFAEGGDLTDVEEGRNINIRRKGTDMSFEYKIRVSEPCPFPGDIDMLDDIVDVTTLVPFLSYEKANGLLLGDATSSADAFDKAQTAEVKRLPVAKPEDDDDEEDEPPVPAATNVKQEDDEDEEDDDEEEAPAKKAPAKKEPDIINVTAKVVDPDDEDEGPHPAGCRCVDCKVAKSNGAPATDDPEAARAAEAKGHLQDILNRTRTKATK